MTFHGTISILYLVANYYFDINAALTCYNTQSMNVTANDITTCENGQDMCQFSVEFGQEYWRRGCTSSQACEEECVSFVSGSSGNYYNRTSCCCSTDNCNAYESLAAKGASTYINNYSFPDPTIVVAETTQDSLSCYSSQAMEVDGNDIVTCSGAENACEFRTKFGRNYWRRGCTLLSACGYGEGCHSSLEDDGNGGQYNVTSCCCTEDNCNGYTSIAAKGESTTTTTTRFTSTPSSTDSDSTANGSSTQSGSLRCYSSSSMEVSSDDIITCTDSDNACSFRTKSGQDYWRRGCTILSACGSGEGCTTFAEDDGNGEQYNVTSCCCTENTCNGYSDTDTDGDGPVVDTSGCNYIGFSSPSLWLMILFVLIGIN